MKLALNLPSQEGSDRKPELRPAKVATWLQSTSERDTTTAARLIGDALASINRASVSDARRFELTAQYWKTAQTLWNPLARHFVRAPQPAHRRSAKTAARAALVLATELRTRTSGSSSTKPTSDCRWAGRGSWWRWSVAHCRRLSRVLVNSYLSYSPVPHRRGTTCTPSTCSRARAISTSSRAATDPADATPEIIYVQSLLLAARESVRIFARPPRAP